MELFWGDLHNHCGISYGYGSLANALTAAREQLDFCAVTGHAFWPDIPEPSPNTAYLVDFHRRGFARLAERWDEVLRAMEEANRPGEFVTFQSYEVHSRRYGDHHILSTASDLPLLEAHSPAEIVARLAPRPAMAIPHHIGYVPGYRGIAWDAFSDETSPLIEVYSKHGSAFSDGGPYPYLHTMGPRDGHNTALAGLRRGLRFAFSASTDHHAGYPGSFGDGRVAVWAEAQTRASIWEALQARRAYAVTGDKIACRFTVNGAPMGATIAPQARRELLLEARGAAPIEQVIVYRNGLPWQAETLLPVLPGCRPGLHKVRIEMGWGYADTAFTWEGFAEVLDGSLEGVETCFRGRNVLAPSRDRRDDPDVNALDNRRLAQDGRSLAWRCQTVRNPTTLHPATSAVILELAGDAATRLRVTLNGMALDLTLDDLCRASHGVHLQDYASEACLVHRAAPESAYAVSRTWTDSGSADRTAGASGYTPTDSYCVEVRQANGQLAWISPVFLER